MKRSDLICESGIIGTEEYAGNVHTKSAYGTEFYDMNISAETGKRFGIKPGRYVTLFSGKGNVKRCLTDILSEMLPQGSALAVGLGNVNIGSDSLGVKALRHIPATAHLSGHSDFTDLGMRSVYVLETGVTGKTGIESSSRAVCTARYVGADVMIAIDSLACADIGKLCSVIQITDTGISPGSGVGNDRKALDSETAGIPVIAIGVPTVIDLDSVSDIAGSNGLMVTPRNIDVLTDRFAETIGMALSRALNRELSEDELRSLIIL